ncbi:protein-L-isoaspartate O-methyltransferase [Kordiimonas sp. SCSIO 12603]|uniref:protein-L-isoaspartate O-methyltransferase family protein n=1 Tax=Kordiimonas sp. SCSIO 12603 TaxID=2829596 RepID=UPI0021031EF6|nr:protein-L-isoaspartate O-methyltransferase [Kordiimonas sp. SCSIO 12603]UTW57707.1 protein-L-isoaspartate O-methyltransferase [Kordiimonas sp. SCSIO 12603]
MSDFETARNSMIDCQLRPNEVNDERIIAAIRAVPKENFVPKAKRSIAYVDEDLEVADGRFIMEPTIFARLLVAADVKDTDLVLDIGPVTGYSSAVIAGLADAVVALEGDEAFAKAAETKLSDADIMNVAVVNGDMKEGVAKQGPFDVIFIEGAVDEVPEALVKQLKENGRLLCVKVEAGVGRAHIITNKGDELEAKNLFDANVEAIPGFEKAEGFVF